MRWLIAFSLALSFALSPTQQTTLGLSAVEVEHAFGEWIEFQAQADSGLQLTSLEMIVSVGSSSDSIVVPGLIEDQNHLIAVYDLSQHPWIRPFEIVSYRFFATTAGGQRLESQDMALVYTDNRFEWQFLSLAANLDVYWIQGDLLFGQSIANAAERGRARFRELTTLAPVQPIRLYVYPSSADLQTALNLRGDLLAAGHAAGEDGLAWAAVPPGPEQDLAIQQIIPHELAHVLLYQSLGPAYSALPAWLNEGLASATELYPNPDYALVIDRAAEGNALLPLSELCARMPQDAASAILAYAQADSFVRYLVKSYGPRGMASTLQTFAHGASCEDGPQPATGRTLSQLEADWLRDELDGITVFPSLDGVSAWLIIAVLAVAGPVVSILRRTKPALR